METKRLMYLQDKVNAIRYDYDTTKMRIDEATDMTKIIDLTEKLRCYAIDLKEAQALLDREYAIEAIKLDINYADTEVMAKEDFEVMLRNIFKALI